MDSPSKVLLDLCCSAVLFGVSRTDLNPPVGNCEVNLDQGSTAASAG